MKSGQKRRQTFLQTSFIVNKTRFHIRYMMGFVKRVWKFFTRNPGRRPRSDLTGFQKHRSNPNYSHPCRWPGLRWTGLYGQDKYQDPTWTDWPDRVCVLPSTIRATVCAPSRCALFDGKHTGHSDSGTIMRWADFRITKKEPVAYETGSIYNGHMLKNQGYRTRYW